MVALNPYVTLDYDAINEIQYALTQAQQLLEGLQTLLDAETCPRGGIDPSLLRIAYVVSEKIDAVDKILESAWPAAQNAEASDETALQKA